MIIDGMFALQISIEIVPEFISSRPAIILKIVDLPQPLGPTRTVKATFIDTYARFENYTDWSESENVS